MARHFGESLAMNAGVTLHLEVTGENAHHEVEALFKGADPNARRCDTNRRPQRGSAQHEGNALVVDRRCSDHMDSG